MDPKYALLYDTVFESLFTGTRCLCKVTTNLPSTISKSAEAQWMLSATASETRNVFTLKEVEDEAEDVTENDDIFVTEVCFGFG